MASRNLFRNALDTYLAARQRQADRYVSDILLSLDDATLARHGYSREALRRRTL